MREQLSLLGGPEALDHLYEHHGEAALVHLFRVASSLDSMVLGEAQILGQVKDAFELGQSAGAVRGELTRVCAAAFGCAKRVRTETAIGRSARPPWPAPRWSWRARSSTGSRARRCWWWAPAR